MPEELIEFLKVWGRLPIETAGVVMLGKILWEVLELKRGLALVKVRLGIVEKKNGIVYPQEMIP